MEDEAPPPHLGFRCGYLASKAGCCHVLRNSKHLSSAETRQYCFLRPFVRSRFRPVPPDGSWVAICNCAIHWPAELDGNASATLDFSRTVPTLADGAPGDCRLLEARGHRPIPCNMPPATGLRSVVIHDRETTDGDSEAIRKFFLPTLDPFLAMTRFFTEQESTPDTSSDAMIPAGNGHVDKMRASHRHGWIY